ncbi:hypothetical protein QTG54_014980 [Skeletonema marinoi]|uniref:MYND-type domain-containing protein n=1 Tax=Skeletonema marinoi TaxID=267567 RepID=A0AAD8XV22_9STRA|nr:hypothetical protein QTG54_014980 [Skeletonema marinoi]
MGRKRNQGKARKAAKAKAKEEERGNNNNNQRRNERQQSLAALLQQLQSGAASDTTLCRHGFEQIDKMCTDLVIAFRDAFYDNTDGGDADILDCLIAAEDATMDKFADVWNNSAKMEIAISSLLSMGTEYVLCVLDGNYVSARDFATFARYFEQHVAVKLHQTQALVNFPKICETYHVAGSPFDKQKHPSDLHTLVKFFRKRIPCCCLDEKYEEVKGVTKMGWCFNLQCNLLRVERSKTMYCDRCRFVTYCSPECQKAHWSKHQATCDAKAAAKAKFEAKQQDA